VISSFQARTLNVDPLTDDSAKVAYMYVYSSKHNHTRYFKFRPSSILSASPYFGYTD